MILSGKEIQKHLGDTIFIDPFNPEQLNPNSYNLKVPNPSEKIQIPEEGLLLEPRKLYLGRTVEHTRTDTFVPMLEGRSSVGRLGLFVHVTAGFGDVGFNGFWTLEMFCVQPIRVYAGVEICQVFYHSIQGDYHTYKGGKYQDNTDIQASKFYEDMQ